MGDSLEDLTVRLWRTLGGFLVLKHQLQYIVMRPPSIINQKTIQVSVSTSFGRVLFFKPSVFQPNT